MRGDPKLLSAGALALALLFPSLALGEKPIPLCLPIRQPLKIDSFLVARRIPVSTNSLDVRVITEIEGTISDAVAFGDTDHDGRNEVIILGYPCGYRVFEEQGNNLYSMEYSGACLQPYATGDLDADGKAELVAQSGGFVQVYESPDASSYPTELVWSSEYLSNIVGMTAIGDTDRDGRMEIVHSQNYFGPVSIFVIFENRGDNTFVPVFSDTIPDTGAVGTKAIADFDGDGLTEIAFSGIYGRVYVYESPANDTWVRTWKSSTGMLNAYAVAVGADADRNGRPELFVMGSSHEWTTMVYEASGDNFFERVATLSIADGYEGTPHNAVVNLDNLGLQEYVMETAVGLWIYRARGPGQWDLVGQFADLPPNRAHDGIYGFDLNQNGRPEVIWAGGPTTLILEYRSGITDVGENPYRNPGSLAAFPNPCRVEAQLRVSAAVNGATSLAVYDVAGRVVERRALIRDARGQILWPTQRMASGVYLLRLEDTMGRTLAVGRGTVMR